MHFAARVGFIEIEYMSNILNVEVLFEVVAIYGPLLWLSYIINPFLVNAFVWSLSGLWRRYLFSDGRGKVEEIIWGCERRLRGLSGGAR